MAAERRDRQARSERRSFLVGAIGLLLAMVLLARIQISTVDGRSSQAPLPGIKVNVNTADAQTLALLSQIGAERAAQIILYRDSHGPFQTLPDLMRVTGIGPKTVEGLVGQICFSGPAAGEF